MQKDASVDAMSVYQNCHPSITLCHLQMHLTNKPMMDLIIDRSIRRTDQ